MGQASHQNPSPVFSKALISGAGPDRPGIVAAITGILLKHGANIEDSTMTRLAEEFALILIVSIDQEETLSGLQADFKALENSMGMSLTLKKLSTHANPPSQGQPCMIAVAGNDRTGITHSITQQLARLNVNITDLNAHVIEGEDGPAYIMMVETVVPEELSLESLQAQLKQAEGHQKLEIRVSPLEDVAL